MNFNVFDKITLRSEDTIALAKALLGHLLISQIDNHLCVGKIVETEAYRAPHDKGSHAYGNRKTARTSTMFENGGIAYIYLCYGIHNMLNLVTGPQDHAHAILIRALEPLVGIDIMQSRRRQQKVDLLCNGPGKLCQAMGITRMHNAVKLYDRTSPIFLASSFESESFDIREGPRVGIAYAEECAYYPWRFSICNNRFVSKPEEVCYTH